MASEPALRSPKLIPYAVRHCNPPAQRATRQRQITLAWLLVFDPLPLLLAVNVTRGSSAEKLVKEPRARHQRVAEGTHERRHSREMPCTKSLPHLLARSAGHASSFPAAGHAGKRMWGKTEIRTQPNPRLYPPPMDVAWLYKIVVTAPTDLRLQMSHTTHTRVQMHRDRYIHLHCALARIH